MSARNSPPSPTAVADPQETTDRSAGDGGLPALMCSSGLMGVAGAMVVTSTSLFLADSVRVPALQIGLFFAGRATAEIATDLVVGVLSDRLGRRRVLLAVCSTFSAIGALSYAFLRDYFLLLAAGAVFFGIGGATFAQIFAYTREYAHDRGQGMGAINARVRAVTSAAWIVGPPIGLALLGSRGPVALYGCSAVLYGACAVCCLWWLPDVRRIEDDGGGEPGGRNPFARLTPKTAVLLTVIVIMLSVNQIFQIDVALFVTRDRGLGSEFVGLLLGVASAVEIPIMLYLGSRVAMLGPWQLVLAATVVATGFFLLLPLAHGPVSLLLLQVPNAMWTAVVMSVPVIILQDSMAAHPGAASALYASAFKAGAFLGGFVAGTVGALLGYAQVFWACAALTLIAAVLVVLVRRDREQPRHL
jgi:MFS transporter, SET family, sugar efflux transporter